MTLDQLEEALRRAGTDPAKLYGDDKKGFLKRVMVACHPDLYPGKPDEAARADRLRVRVFELTNAAAPTATVVKSPKREYTLVGRLGIGDVADVHRAVGDGKEYVLKISRVVGGDKLLETEEKSLLHILGKVGETKYDGYFPTPCESFLVRDAMQKRVNVFLYEPGFYTLEQVHAQHPRLDHRDLAWIFKRLLTAIGFAHLCGIVHGAVCPAHAQVHATSDDSPDRGHHGLQLLGWGQSVKTGSRVTGGSSRYASWYPREVRNKQPALASTDVFMVAKCIVYLAGGDAGSDQIPGDVPAELRRFLRSCLLEGSKMRPEDAWGLHQELDEVLRGIYGAPKYHNLVMHA